MAWKIPTLTDLAERTRASFQTYLPASNFSVWPSAAGVSAKVIAARIYELFHRQAYVAQQSMPISATGEYLERHAQQYGLSRAVEVKASGTIQVSGGTPGAKIPNGTQYQSSTGDLYDTLSDAYIDQSGGAVVKIQSSVFGADYNLDGGSALTMLAVITGVPADAAVSADGVFGGAEIEGDESLRERLLERLRFPPAAGSRHDYRRWASDIPGVTRVWVEPNAFGPGTVGVWFTMDDAYDDGIPQAADVAAVQAHISNLAPITANVTVQAPNREPVRIEVTGLQPYSSSVIDAVKAEIKSMIREKAQTSTADNVQYIRASWIWQAISNATGERYHTVVLPHQDYVIPIGSIPVFDESYISLEG